jgi:Protein of unknown function (DUF3106)
MRFVMKHRPTIFLVACLASFVPTLLLAQAAPGDSVTGRPRWEAMTPEQREAVRQKARERWAAMTPEQRAEIGEKRRARWAAMTPEQQEVRRAEARERFKSLSPEEQARIRQRMQARRQAQALTAGASAQQ